MTGPEVTAAVERAATSYLHMVPHCDRCHDDSKLLLRRCEPCKNLAIEFALHMLDAALVVEEMVETLVPVVYAQNQAHYEDSEGFMHVQPWEWLTPEFQESIRAEAREYVGYLRAALLGGDS